MAQFAPAVFLPNPTINYLIRRAPILQTIRVSACRFLPQSHNNMFSSAYKNNRLSLSQGVSLNAS